MTTTGALDEFRLALVGADRLGCALELVVFDTAAQSVDAVTQRQADIGFFAIDPKRGEGLHFTAAYVLIEGSYLVRADSPLQANDEVDRPGVRIDPNVFLEKTEEA